MAVTYAGRCVAWLFAAVVVCSFTVDPNTIRCPASQPFGFIRDPSNCSMYYRCVFGKVIPTGGCASGTVFSTYFDTCVLPGSSLDNCVSFKKNEGEQKDQSAQGGPHTELSPIRRCVRKDQAFPHPTECGLFYNCSLVCDGIWTKKFLELMLDQCPQSLWFNSDTMMCENAASVNCGSRKKTQFPYAAPILNAERLTPQQVCNRGATVFPHPLYCNTYYNCSHVHSAYRLFRGRFIEQYLLECSYPKLFNAETLRCEEFANVSCGSRKETKNFCEYRASLCEGSHCIPCSSRSAVCENIQDGPHYMECNPFSHQYAECKDERLIDINRCKKDKSFSPIDSRCIDWSSIPGNVRGINWVDRYYKIKDMKRQG